MFINMGSEMPPLFSFNMRGCSLNVRIMDYRIIGKEVLHDTNYITRKSNLFYQKERGRSIVNNTAKQAAAAPERFVLHRRIGSTTYRARIYFNQEAKETLDDKVLRLLRNDLNLTPGHATMVLSQTGRLSDGSSV